MRMHHLAIVGCALLALSGMAHAQATTQAAGEPPLTVAILDFEAPTADTGKQVTETLTGLLAGTKGVTFVDRAAIHKTLAEQELNLTGMVDAKTAVKIGNLVGARILVTGKVFTLGKSTYVTAKIIGTETTLVEGVLAQGDDIGALVNTLAEKLGKQLVEAGPRLVKVDAGDEGKYEALRARLLKMKLPTVSVSVKEQHLGGARQGDPAVEQELKAMLLECGFKVMDAAGADAEFKVTGEAFSELGGRVGNLVSCTARAEVSMSARADAKIVMAGRTTQRATDLAENIAGKTALQKAGRIIGLQILEHFAKTEPATAPATK